MKREGRQHGMVRNYMILPPPWNSSPQSSKVVNQFSSPPTAGMYTKVPAKPTNHSKFTSKCSRPRCAGCHTHPACKSEGKCKGARKLRSLDVSMNHRLLAWRVVDKGVGFHYCTGISATGMVSYLSGDYSDSTDDDDDDDDDEAENGVQGDVEVSSTFPAAADGLEVESSNLEEEEEDAEMEGEGGGNEHLGFFHVGLEWDFVDDYEDWCFVEHM